ncbi:MAG: hypothetical protein ABR928_03125 [Terracidiphilus sp.]|jgi:hypothetical protein
MRRNCFCYFHSRAHSITRTSSRDDLLLPIAEGHAAVQLAVHQITQALLARQIDAKEAGIMLYGIQIASQHIKDESEDTTDSELFFANPSEGEGLAIPLCIREVGDKADHDNCSNCGQRFSCNDCEPTKEEKEWFESQADLGDDEEDDQQEEAGNDLELPAEAAQESVEITGNGLTESLASAHEVSEQSHPENEPLVSDHGISPSEKERLVTGNGPSCTEDETLVSDHGIGPSEKERIVSGNGPSCTEDETLVSDHGIGHSEKESLVSGHGFSRAEKPSRTGRASAPEGCIAKNIAAVGAQRMSPDPPRKRSPHAPGKRKGAETPPAIKLSEAIALFKALIKLNSTS